MKKVLCLLLALTMVACLMTSCGKFDIENEDLGAYIKLGDMTSFSYDEICERYEAYREELSADAENFYPTTGYTVDFLLKTEIVGEDGIATTFAPWTHDTDADLVKGYEMFRKEENHLFDQAFSYNVEDASETSTDQRLVTPDKAFSFTMTVPETCETTEVAGKTVRFTITVKKVLPAVYTDGYIADRLLSFYNAVSTSKDEIEDGDTVTFQYTLTCGETKIGSGTNCVVVIGSGTFGADLEAKLVGHQNGEEFEITMTLPADYAEADYAGKEATYAIKVKDVYNDDTLIQDYTGLNDMWELKYVLRVQCFAEYCLFQFVEDRSELISYPEKLLAEFESVYSGLVKKNVSAAVSYYASIGQSYSKAEMRETLYPDGSDQLYITENAKKSAFSYMVCVAAKKALDLTYTGEDYDKDLKALAEEYSTYYGSEITTRDVEEEYSEAILRMTFLRAKLTDFLLDRIVGAPEIPQKD